MAQYLIVTHKTATAPEVREKVGEVVAADPDAEFGILVPSLPGESHSWEGEGQNPARQSAEALNEILERELGAKVIRLAVGAEDPLQAIADELETHPQYDSLLICTLPLGASQWLRRDLVHQAGRKFGKPVTHVIGTVVPA
jgi:hypothetical protein